MDTASLIISVASVALSIFAVCKARSAYGMAKTVIGRKNEHEDAQRLREMIATLNTAKKVAMRRANETTRRQLRSHSDVQDIECLRDAQDVLRTKLPLAWTDQQRTDAIGAAKDIEIALTDINDAKAGDGWKSARNAIQIIVPELEQEERKLVNRSLIPPRT